MKSETLELIISDLSRGGSGLAREPSGRVVFVPHTAPGDRVKVCITHEKKHFAEARLLEVLEASPLRIPAPCTVFGQCGGCQWQHLPYDFQWKTKLAGVRHALTRVQLTPPEPLDELPAEKIWNYRNRIQLRGNADQLGFFAPGSHQLIPVERCEIARPELNQALDEAKTDGKALGAPYKVELEVSEDGKISKTFNRAHAAQGFRQIHDEQNQKLRVWVAQAISPGLKVLDLFGGSGNLAGALAERASGVDCVDVSSPIERPVGFPTNVDFHRSEVVPWLVRQWRKGSKAQAAVLDPPRTGLAENHSEVATALEQMGVQELVTIGCDVDNWARDVSRFVRRGWHLEKFGVLDLFPQTPHAECLAIFKR